MLAVYMVGSDLEEVNGFGTDDLNEMPQAEDNLVDLEVVVAFGGSSNWKGMRFTDLGQIRADFLEDEKFGNAAGYLHEAPGAHMGDVSSLKKFLDQLGPVINLAK